MPDEKILMVEDEENNLKILSNYLLSETHDIDTAANGEDLANH